MAISIRMANVGDSKAILDIYKYYVENSNVTLEFNPPTLNEMEDKITKVLEHYPFLVMEYYEKEGEAFKSDDEFYKNFSELDMGMAEIFEDARQITEKRIIGFAYAQEYRALAGFNWNVELSCYFKDEETSKGYGEILCNVLLDVLAKQNVRNVYSCITFDNIKSIGLHKKLGFKECGAFPNSCYKNGKWHSVLWFSKEIGEEKTEKVPEEIINISQIPGIQIELIILRHINKH